MVTYSTPGVYVEEISTLAPSVASVATAIPVFIGYTGKGPLLEPTRIDTMLDYVDLFGGANPSAFGVSGDNTITRTDAGTNKFLMYYGLSLYFQNGGGSCYILSVGGYDKTIAKADFDTALDVLEKEDEPTLIVLLDATTLSVSDYYALCNKALVQCNKLGDRFLLVDIPDSKTDDFRNSSEFGSNNLCYAAAYHPYLNTTLNFQYQEDKVTQTSVSGSSLQWSAGDNGINVVYSGTSASPKVKITADATGTNKAEFAISSNTLNIKTAATPPSATDVVAAWNTWKNTGTAAGFDISVKGNGSDAVAVTTVQTLAAIPGATLASLKQSNTVLYNQIKSGLATQRVTLPPSPAIAGVYASVDRDRGVWKSPANVSLNGVIGPVSKISDTEQDRLNIDPTAGKSINAIRDFTGKGTLVWGARTLAGNDNEWRYVSVRRLFITIEESTRKASAFAVFEPNDATTWLKVKAMIESYLYSLWQQGALAGSKPESAYFVSVGLGKTMTAQDILEGRMIVSIGVAAVRPAEFIILRFSHKMQEA
ncbi:MAG: phage tail sheath family protein [Methylobacter sp.]